MPVRCTRPTLLRCTMPLRVLRQHTKLRWHSSKLQLPNRLLYRLSFGRNTYRGLRSKHRYLLPACR